MPAKKTVSKNVSIEANGVEPEGAVTVCRKRIKTFLQTMKAEEFYCDWRFKD